MKPNITLIGINFYPEDTAIGLYSTQMMEYLAKTNNVEVITGFPYYPEWEIRKEFQDKPTFLTETKENITIHRYKQYVPKNPTFKHRIFHLLDFTLGSFRNIFKVKKSDLVICVVPFTTAIVLGLVLAKLRGAKVWIHIQDFEFDAAVESGLASENGGLKAQIFKGLFWLEKKLLNKADIISTISGSMLVKLVSKTDNMNYFFPNWVDENFIDPNNATCHALMSSNKFKVLYSGSIGAKQDWEFFLRVVEAFQVDDNIEFIVVGAGAKKEWLMEQSKSYENVKHHLPVDYATLPDLLCSADLHILFQKNNVVDTVMPSKLLGMMASGVPSVITGNMASEVATVLEKSKGGYFYDAQNFEEVVSSIEELRSNTNKRHLMGFDARAYVIDHFSASEVLSSFQKQVQKLIEGDI